MREENEKHFRLSDGTYEAVVYSQPVHRKDKDGIWQDIDNTIELKSDSNVSKYVTQDSRVSFANKFEVGSDLFVLSENGYSISMSLLNGGNGLGDELGTTDFDTFDTPTVNNSAAKRTATVFNSLEEAKNIKNKSSIVYNNIRENTNLEYVLSGNDVKENIIINAPCESYEYIFQITLDGLYAELDGNVIFIKDTETNQTKYTVPAPYMYDAEGNYSYDVSYELERVKDELYLLVISANEEWINSEERTFPVVVDPTVTTSFYGYDSYINSAAVNTNYGLETDLWVSTTCTAFIYLPLPAMPSGATLNNAYLYVPYYYHITTGSLRTGAYKVTSSWAENTIKYSNAPQLNEADVQSYKNLAASTSITASTPGSAKYSIIKAAREWFQGTAPNYGIAIKREESTTATNQSVLLLSYELDCEEPAYISVNYSYTLAEGVYAFENASLNNYWISVEDDSCFAGSKLQYEISSVDPTASNVFDRSRLFKVTRVGNYDRYTIRSMLNNNLSFNIVGDKIVTKEIPSIDVDVPLADTFFIYWNGGGFTIEPYNSSNIISVPSSSSSDLSFEPDSSESLSTRWIFKQYTGEHRYGAKVYSSEGVLAVNSALNIKVAVQSTYIGSNTPRLYSAYNDEDKIIFEWDDSSCSGIAIFGEQGTMEFDCRIYTEDMLYYYQVDINVFVAPVAEGIYFLQNAQKQRYVTEHGFSPVEGEIVSQDDYNDGMLQQWNISYTSSDCIYVTIQSVANGMYLGVDSVDPTAIVQYLDKNDYTYWKIEITSNKNYKITPYLYELNEKVLTAGDDYDLTLSTYVPYSGQNTSCRDEWCLVRKVISIVNYYDASFEENETLQSYIEDAVDFANIAYSKYYHIGIHMDGVAIRKQTNIDNCSKTHLNSPCDDSCASDCRDHHKNTVSVSTELYNSVPRADNHIYVFWSHRPGAYCNREDDPSTEAIDYKHMLKGSVAVVYSGRPIIHFLNIPSYRSTDTKYKSMSITLVHEIAHIIGMPEMYVINGHDSDDDTNCVMERLQVENYGFFYSDVLNSEVNPFCSMCRLRMFEEGIIFNG